MTLIEILSLGLLLTLSLKFGESLRILAIFPTPSISHQVVLRQFSNALRERGYELVVITPLPIGDNRSKNYTEISTELHHTEMMTVDFVKMKQEINCLQFITDFWWESSLKFVKDIYENPEFRKIYAPDSGEKFDLIIFEVVTYEGLYGLAKRFDAPYIGISTFGLTSFAHYINGDEILPSHPSTWEQEEWAGANLPFWQRFINFVRLRHFHYRYHSYFLQRQDELAKKYLGSDTPNVIEIGKNMSLLFVDQHTLISHVRPNLPNIIHFDSIHVVKNPEPLPKDLQEFLDGATEGFVYVSLGSNAKSKFLPQRLKDTFLEVFSKLTQRVLWKFEDDLPEKPDNVFVSKWLPQESVLSHPNIKLFVYQGGLRSTEEAVHYAVPLLGIPILADQYSQITKLVSLGVAKLINLLDLNKNNFQSAINEILNDNRYKEKMSKVSNIIKDRPYDHLEHALWWIEFVIRHQGAAHLRSTIADESFYQRTDMDVVAFIGIAIFIGTIAILIISYKFLSVGYQLRRRLTIKKKRKIF